MLFLLFQVGQNRYALEARRVVEVIPLLELKPLAQAPRGVAGVFNYHGRPVPAVDLSAVILGRPASELLSTRIIIVNHPDDSGASRLLGLIAERATGMLRKDARDFIDPGFKQNTSTQVGPILMDGNGPIHWVHEQRWLSEGVSKLLSSEPALASRDAN
jgi:chemotaxis-related protein WspB